MRAPPAQLEGFWSTVGDIGKFAANVVTAPVRLPVELVKAVGTGASQIIGATGGLVGAVAQAPGQIIGGLRPAQQKPDPALLAAMGLGSSGAGGSSLAVPLMVGGGLLAVGVLVFALTRKKRGS